MQFAASLRESQAVKIKVKKKNLVIRGRRESIYGVETFLL